MKNNAINSRIVLLFVLVFSMSTVQLKAEALAQGPLGGPVIALIANFSGFVQVSRAATPQNKTRITQLNFQLANGDTVQTLAGQAEIRFNDASIVTMNPGTIVVVSERQVAGGIQRTISQILGNLWFNITKATGAGGTTLQTPTAVAAIRGTIGTQDVPNPDQSTHALQEGLEQITENVTQQSIVLRPGQRVTAIRGIGFTPVVAIIGALIQPVIGGGGGGAGGGGGGGGGVAGGGVAGGAGGATTAAAGASVASATASSISSLAATFTSIGLSAGAAVATAAIPLAVPSGTTSTTNIPLVPPGGAFRGGIARAIRPEAVDGTATTSSVQQQTSFTLAPMNRYFGPATPVVSRLGGTIPLTAASGSIWLSGVLKHDQRLGFTGQRATQAVLIADVFASGMKQFAIRQNSRYIDYRASGNAVRAFAFASVLSRQYHDKPLVVIGSYSFAAAASVASMSGPKRFPTDVLVSAAVGEVIGRILARHHGSKNDQ
jgi:hypothetical protein